MAVQRGGKVLYANAAAIKLFGAKSAQDLTGKPILDLVHPDFRHIVLARAREVIESRAPMPMIEEELLKLDGTAIPVEVQSTVIDYDGEPAILVSMHDISERKRAEEELKRYAQTLAAVMLQLTMAEEQERRAIAADLHDDLTQLLAAANIKMRSLPKPDDSAGFNNALLEATEVIEQAERSARSLSFQISPPLLFELGLVPALQGLADELRKVYGLTAIVRDDGKPKDLSPTARSVLYRATRELLINVAKHAKVEVANVDVHNGEDLLVISVTDSGVGFDKRLAEKHAPGSGFGLASMRERLRLIGGKFDIDTHPGDGTVATLAVPLANASREGGGKTLTGWSGMEATAAIRSS